MFEWEQGKYNIRYTGSNNTPEEYTACWIIKSIYEDQSVSSIFDDVLEELKNENTSDIFDISINKAFLHWMFSEIEILNKQN